MQTYSSQAHENTARINQSIHYIKQKINNKTEANKTTASIAYDSMTIVVGWRSSMGVTTKKPAVICFYGRNSTCVELVTGKRVEIPFIATKYANIFDKNNADQANNRILHSIQPLSFSLSLCTLVKCVTWCSENKIKYKRKQRHNIRVRIC